MKQYIDRETAINELNKPIPEYLHDNGVYYKTILQHKTAEIEKIPVADVRENIHAKWIWKDFNHDGFHILCCSECYNTEGTREDAKFCSECGAVMDLE